MNVNKTKSMVISKKQQSPKINSIIEGKSIEQTPKIIYLRYMQSENGKCEAEIKRRTEIARKSFEKMSNILTSRNIKIEIRKRLLKCYVWSTLLYGTETWTLTNVLTNILMPLRCWHIEDL